MVIVKLTEMQWQTAYTALRMERERHKDGDPDIVKELNSAIDAMQKWEAVK